MATDDLLKHAYACMLAVQQGDLRDHDWIATCMMHASMSVSSYIMSILRNGTMYEQNFAVSFD